MPPDHIGVFQPDGGFIAVEPAIATMIAQAQAAGADMRTSTAALSVAQHGGGVRVETTQGDIDARSAVIAAGPWIKTLLPDVPAPLRITRQVMGWFQPLDPTPFAAGRFPVFLLESRHGVHYGFPPFASDAIKVARHHHADETVDPDRFGRAVSAADEALIRAALADHIPAANGALAAAKTCLYTVTPDRDFLIDRLPGARNIIVASPCSGHGFKFAPVVGEILVDLATGGGTDHDISRFRFGRFG
jgi:sarcosine oxidase